MEHSDFSIGTEFKCGGMLWRCTDIGTRIIVAIRISFVVVDSNNADLRRIINQEDATSGGWFEGPPYSVAEHVFDEDDQVTCEIAKEE